MSSLGEVGCHFEDGENGGNADDLVPTLRRVFHTEKNENESDDEGNGKDEKRGNVLVRVISLIREGGVLTVLGVDDVHFRRPEKMCKIEEIRRKREIEGLHFVQFSKSVIDIGSDHDAKETEKKVRNQFRKEELPVSRGLYFIEICCRTVFTVRAGEANACREHTEEGDEEGKTDGEFVAELSCREYLIEDIQKIDGKRHNDDELNEKRNERAVSRSDEPFFFDRGEEDGNFFVSLRANVVFLRMFEGLGRHRIEERAGKNEAKHEKNDDGDDHHADRVEAEGVPDIADVGSRTDDHFGQPHQRKHRGLETV